RFRSELWPNSVWPGALLVNGDLVGTWRRQVGRVTVRAWRPLEPEVKEAVGEEVSRMPIESATKEVRWSAGDGPLSVARRPLVSSRTMPSPLLFGPRRAPDGPSPTASPLR